MQVLREFLELLASLFFNPITVVLLIVVIIRVKKERNYRKGAYYQITKYPYASVRYNLGRYGEYLTYEDLKEFENDGAKFLFNVYIPKENGDTTEIDVLMICKKGIFAIESKNYSGWIFGDEKQKYWYQTLPSSRGQSHKEQFYNPIMQNRSHIKHLRSFLGEEIPIQSFIVFSNRCTLKSVHVTSPEITVINRCDVASFVSARCYQIPSDLLSVDTIEEIYQKLYPFTQVTENVKLQHVTNIHNTLNDQAKQGQCIETVNANNVELNAVTSGMTLSENVEEPVPICPKCNGKLILRTATKGANAGNQFYGCSNFPKCRYIQNIKK